MNWGKASLVVWLFVLWVGCGGGRKASAPTEGSRFLEKRDYGIQRALIHWSGYDEPGYLDWAGEAKVQFMQVGFFGPILYCMANSPGRENWHPIPREGYQANYDYYRDFIRRAHAKGIKVNGHFSMSYLFGDPAEGKERGWFDFIKHRWDESVLGPRPSADPFDYIQRYGDGRPIMMTPKEDARLKGLHDLNKYWGCPNNPNWQAALKAMVKTAIGLGLDGITGFYSYRLNCACPYCQKAFRQYLQARFTPQQIRERFGIDNVESYSPMEIPPAKTGTAQNDALRAEAQIFSQRSQKGLVNQVLIGYGRQLKPDLMVAVWRHFYAHGYTDEQGFLPSSEYSKGESCIWFCMGGGANTSKLAEHNAGDSTLTAKYAGRMMAGKPVLINKYDHTRLRLAIAEAAALGGMSVPQLTAFQYPADRALISHYFHFLDANNRYYYPSQTYSEIALVYSRRAKSLLDTSFEDPMFTIGRHLINNHYLFDVVVDDLLTPKELERYKVLILPGTRYFDKGLTDSVEQFVRSGGRVLLTGETARYDESGSKLQEPSLSFLKSGKDQGKSWAQLTAFEEQPFLKALESGAPGRLSHLDGPWT
ncbi:MAG TPA: beta-galactosidase trimerization domain-containing protein, partial [Bryobacterales bacterium]|nr:beta-galactosidase trimerization domain-containing protein [Bryobacterales bacterium]